MTNTCTFEMGENPRAAFCPCSQHLLQAPCDMRLGSYQWNVGGSDASPALIQKAPRLFSLSLALCLSVHFSLRLSELVCHGVVRALGCLESEPRHMPQGAWERCSEEGQEGPSWIASQHKPQYRWALSHLASPWGQCACARLFLSSVIFSCYFPPISVLSSMASTRCWASVLTNRLTVWPLSASVEIRSRDGEKGCWEGDGAGNASTRAFLKDSCAWSPLPTFYEIRAFDPRPLDSQEQGRDF